MDSLLVIPSLIYFLSLSLQVHTNWKVQIVWLSSQTSGIILEPNKYLLCTMWLWKVNLCRVVLWG